MRLADDLMEPFRPLVDFCVFKLARQGKDDVTPDVKKELVSLLARPIQTDKGAIEINYLIGNLAVSLARCALGKAKRLDIPPPVTDMALWGL